MKILQMFFFILCISCTDERSKECYIKPELEQLISEHLYQVNNQRYFQMLLAFEQDTFDMSNAIKIKKLIDKNMVILNSKAINAIDMMELQTELAKFIPANYSDDFYQRTNVAVLSSMEICSEQQLLISYLYGVALEMVLFDINT